MSSICFRIQIDGSSEVSLWCFLSITMYTFGIMSHTHPLCLIFKKKNVWKEAKEAKEARKRPKALGQPLYPDLSRTCHSSYEHFCVSVFRCDWYKSLECLHCYTDELWAQSCIWKTENGKKKKWKKRKKNCSRAFPTVLK